MAAYASVTRLAAVGLDTPRSEALPWSGGTTEVVVRDSAGVEVSGSPFTATLEAGRWAYSLPARGDLGTLTERWENGEQSWVAEVQVRGGDPFPFAELDDRLRNGSTTNVTEYPVWKQRIALGSALLELERVCRTALVPRRSVVQVRGRVMHDEIDTGHLSVLEVVDITAPGIDPADCEIEDDGTVTLPYPVMGPFTITVDHGEYGDPDIATAVAGLAALALQDGNWDERGYTQIEQGAYMRILTAGVNGAEFSLPAAEAVYKRYRVLEIG